jgi:hypothetical protein
VQIARASFRESRGARRGGRGYEFLMRLRLLLRVRLLLRLRLLSLPVAAALLVSGHAGAERGAESDLVIDAAAWRIVPRHSGPVNYYAPASERAARFVRARYVPPMKTAVLGFEIPEADRRRAKKLRWTWRATTLPAGGDECVPAKADSAAVVYVTWKRGLRYYTLKYVWSGAGRKGSVCDSKRNAFVAQDTVIVESGGPLGVWRSVEIDLAHQFRHHFEGGDPNAPVPDFVGLGLMTDGDQTRSESAADYGTFVITR